jgi:hypothetical protein
MPAITMKDRQNLPDLAKPIAAKIEALGFRWEFDYEYPVPDPDKTQRLQIRDADHVAQPSEVNRYAAAMKRGVKFPPGVVTKDGYFVDFNTRAKAASKLGWPTFQAFILDVNYQSADQFKKDAVLLLAGAFNADAGNRLTRAETVKLVKSMATSGDFEPARVETVLNLTPGTASNVYAQARAEARAERLGVPFNGSVPPSHRTKLGQTGEKITDAPWRETVRLTQDAGLTTEELRDLITRILADTEGDSSRLMLLANERAVRGAQISHYKASGRKRPPASTNLRARLAFINSFSGKTGELVDRNPETAREYLELVSAAAQILRQVERAQSEAIAAELPLEVR